MKEQILFVLGLIALGWGIYKWFKVKDTPLLCGLVMFVGLLAQEYPFYLPIEFSFSLYAFLASALICYKVFYKKMDKRFIVGALLFLGVGTVLMVQVFSPEKPRAKIKSLHLSK